MQAETIELLSGKGKFSMEQSLILAEAMDQVIEKAQIVTVPILDARLATVTARIDTLEGRMDARFAAQEAKTDARFASVDARFAAQEAKMDARFASVDARFDSMETKLDARFAAVDAKLERWAIRIVIATVLGQTAIAPIATRVFDSMKQVIASLGH